MRIKIICAVLSQAWYMKSMLKKYCDSLSPGRYYVFDHFRAMCLQKPAVKQEAQRYFLRNALNPTIVRVAARLLSIIGYYTNGNTSSRGEYEALYVSNNHNKEREVKLFSFTRKKILTICKNRAEMDKQLQEYRQLSKAYAMPAPTENSRYANALEVAMVDLKPSAGDVYALREIASAVIAFNKASVTRKPVSDILTFDYGVEIDQMLKEYADMISSDMMRQQLPVCLQHGDLSKDNLIYGTSEDKEGFWWIDWEHALERVFFYDYFFYILNSAIYGDMGPFETYVSGKSDEALQALFSAFGLQYDPKKKKEYFLIFFISFAKERICDLGNAGALKRYCTFLKERCMDRLIGGSNL